PFFFDQCLANFAELGERLKLNRHLYGNDRGYSHFVLKGKGFGFSIGHERPDTLRATVERNERGYSGIDFKEVIEKLRLPSEGLQIDKAGDPWNQEVAKTIVRIATVLDNNFDQIQSFVYSNAEKGAENNPWVGF